MQASRPADQDRLPWLEPYREPKLGRPLPRRGHGKSLLAGAGAAVLLAVGATGYWMGQRGEAPIESQPSATIALPAPRSEPVRMAEAPPAAVAPAAETPVAAKAAPVKMAAKRKSPTRKKKIRSAAVRRAKLNAVRSAQERRALARRWPKMPSPGPAGQVIQLGAFSTPSRANSAYYQRTARYKSLARMPKVVVPVVTKPHGQILYVLRLGTTSRQQSKTVCSNLRVSGDHCLVIG